MNATYNPFRAAAEAVFVEITSEQAKTFYALKAQKDFQNVLDGAITVCAWAYQLAHMTYMMGVQCRAWCDELECDAQTCDRTPPLLPPAKIIPLTPPTDTGKRLLGDAIKAGLKLIEPSTEEVQEPLPGALLLLPVVSSGGKPKKAPKKRKSS